MSHRDGTKTLGPVCTWHTDNSQQLALGWCVEVTLCSAFCIAG